MSNVKCSLAPVKSQVLSCTYVKLKSAHAHMSEGLTQMSNSLTHVSEILSHFKPVTQTNSVYERISLYHMTGYFG